MIMTSMASEQPATPVAEAQAPAGARPLVGVVMAAYNAERTIVEAVQSVLGQSWRELRLVVCDDGSTDATPELLARIADDRLSVVRNATNLGQGAARDRAIQASAAPWLAVIDADDRWNFDRLDKLMAAVDGPDSMVFDDLLLCHDTPYGMKPWKRLRGASAFGDRSSQPHAVPLEALVIAPRLLIKPLFPARLVREHGVVHGDRRFGEDIEFFLRLAALGARLRYVPEPLYEYRISPGSVTANEVDERAMADALRACAALPGLPSRAKAAFDAKLRALSDNEKLYRLARAVRSGRMLQAMRLLIGNPRMAALLPGRLLRRLGYESHRIANAGTRRKAL